MKMLTLNTHSYMEESPEKKIAALTQALLAEDYDIIALQEVNQAIDAETLDAEILASDFNYRTAEESCPIKQDNYAYCLQKQLKAAGKNYFWSWLPVHQGYKKFDEGLAIFSKTPIQEQCWFQVSAEDAYTSHHTRKVLGIKCQLGQADTWIYSVHFSRWCEKEQRFQKEWRNFQELIQTQKQSTNVFLLGDFNVPAHLVSEGYTYITEGTWLDCHLAGSQGEPAPTMEGKIDGWRNGKAVNQRIDYIFYSGFGDYEIVQAERVFDNRKYLKVSDHYGIEVEIIEKQQGRETK